MDTILSFASQQWWSEGNWNDMKIVCEAVEQDKVFKSSWDNELYPRNTKLPSILICILAIILGITTITSLLLKPLRIPLTSQMIGGVIIVGILFSNPDFQYPKLLTPTVIFILKTISNIGLIFQLFTAGLETNMTVIIKRLDLKSVAICVAGSIASVAFSAIAYASTSEFKYDDNNNNNNTVSSSSNGISSLITVNAETFLMVTYNNLYDLGLTNSDIGRLATSISLVVDVLMMSINFIFFIVLPPFTSTNRKEVKRAFIVLGYYVIIFFICRPLVLYIVSLIPEGKGMKRTHFMYIFLMILMVAVAGEVLDEIFAVFVFALSLPEHPLSSIFSEKLEAIVSAVFFPVYCATQGLQINVYSLTKRSIHMEFILIMGYVGKFLGTFFSSRFFDVPFWQSLALSLILCSKGLLDLVSLAIWREKNVLDIEEYTLAAFHFLIFTGALMPLVRLFYEPLSRYSYIFKPNVAESTKSGTFQALACIYKEENLPGIIRLIEAFHSTRANNNQIPIIALQLMRLTGRCTLPLMAPFDQVRSLAIFRTKLAYSTRIVEALLNLERKSKGHIYLKHYIAMASTVTMHNDICSLAFDKDVSLIILPFRMQAQWTEVGISVEDSLTFEREVNKRVLEKAPCSVGMLLDRGDPREGIADTSIYQVAIIFTGGADDQEALAFTRLFSNHPNIIVAVIWLKSKMKDENDEDAYAEMIMSIQDDANKGSNEANLKFKEVAVNDGSDTTKVLLALNSVVDLVVVGRHHDPNYGPLHGLCLDGLCEYPELGILGDFLATPEFRYSVLVIQQDPLSGEKLDLSSKK